MTSSRSVLLGASPYHLLSYSAAFGTTFFQTFIAAPIAFSTLTSESFSTLQSRIFPIYFPLQTAMSVLIIGTFRSSGQAGTSFTDSLLSSSSDSNFLAAILPANHPLGKIPVPTVIAITLPLLTSFVNTVWLGPATKSAGEEKRRLEGLKKEKEKKINGAEKVPAGEGELSSEYKLVKARFGKLHGASSAMNLLTFLGLGWYGVAELARRI